jgi:hypothetical protein
MAAPVASNNAAPVKDANVGAKHQSVLGPAASTFPPSHFNPIPAASALQGGVVGSAYTESITAQGGTTPYSFAVTSGALPSGLSMTTGGLISGTPTAAAGYAFTVTVTDANLFIGSQSFTINVSAPAASNYGFVA